jgi:DNA-binding MarR family transcriptional regulator
MRQIELADLLDIEPITLSRIIDRLEEGGLVERVADPADRRAWRLHVTAKAQPLVEKLRAIADDMIAEAFAGIDAKDIDITRQVLGRVRENASRVVPLNRASNQ